MGICGNVCTSTCVCEMNVSPDYICMRVAIYYRQSGSHTPQHVHYILHLAIESILSIQLDNFSSDITIIRSKAT